MSGVRRSFTLFLPKSWRNRYLRRAIYICIVSLVFSYFQVTLRSRGLEARNEALPDTPTRPQYRGHEILKRWEHAVSKTKYLPEELSEAWIMRQAMIWNHFRELLNLRNEISESATPETMTKIEAETRAAESAILSFMNRSTKTGAFDALKIPHRVGKQRHGLVITAGGYHYRFLLHFLASLRSVINSTIPVEVFFRGPGDMNEEQQRIVSTQFGDVVTRDLLKIEIFNETEVGLRQATFALKPFAVLASEFAEPIMCDADLLFFQDPYLLYNDEAYKETGTLFFHDRLFTSTLQTQPWLKRQYKLTPELKPSTALLSSQFWSRNTHHQESGVVLIDKSRDDVLLSFAFAAWMNGAKQRKYLKKFMHGDKETYWLAFELTKQNYSFMPSYGGIAGKLMGNYIGGENILHFDREMKPMWLNGGALKSKHKWRSPWLQVDHYGLDDGEWEQGYPEWNYQGTGNTWIEDVAFNEICKHMIDLAKEMDEKYKPKELE